MHDSKTVMMPVISQNGSFSTSSKVKNISVDVYVSGCVRVRSLLRSKAGKSASQTMQNDHGRRKKIYGCFY